MRYIGYIICSVLIFFGCRKDPGPDPNGVLSGKIKSIHLVKGASLPYDYHFYYDTVTGYLQTISVDGLKIIEIDKETNGYVLVKRILYYPDTSIAYIDSTKVLVDADGWIYKIAKTDSSYNTSKAEYFTTAHRLDSVRNAWVHDPDNYFYKSRYITLQSSGENIVKTACFLDEFTAAGHIQTLDTIYTGYTAYVNNYMLPQQGNPYPVGGYDVSYITLAQEKNLTLEYIMGINGYFAYRPNKNLLNSFSRNGHLNVTYSYVFNANGQVSRMTLDPDQHIYDFEYY